jgi:hypothetical protein
LNLKYKFKLRNKKEKEEENSKRNGTSAYHGPISPSLGPIKHPRQPAHGARPRADIGVSLGKKFSGYRLQTAADGAPHTGNAQAHVAGIRRLFSMRLVSSFGSNYV